MKPTSTVSATQLVRDLAAIRNLASDGPVGVTSHGRTELIVLNAHRFAEMSAGADAPTVARLEAKLSIVLDTIDTRVVIVDHDLKVRRINRAARLALQLPDETFIGYPIAQLLPSASAAFIAQRLVEVRRSDRIAEFDFTSNINPGRTIHARMLPWPGGIGYFSEDITDRLRSIERDMEYAALREAFVALGNRGCGTIADNGAIRHADAGLARMTGAEAEQLDGRRFVSLFDNAARARIEAAIDRNEARASVMEVGFLHRGVEVTPARLSLAPYFSQDGRPRHAFCLEEIASG